MEDSLEIRGMPVKTKVGEMVATAVMGAITVTITTINLIMDLNLIMDTVFQFQQNLNQ